MNGVRDDGLVVCSCGTLNEDATDLLRQTQHDLANAENELRGKRTRISMLAGDDLTRAKHSPEFPTAMRVLVRWKDICAPYTRELGGKRLVHCVARLKRGRYSEGDLNIAVDGYSRFPYVVNRQRSHVGSPSQWYADAELIFRTPKNVDMGLRMAEQNVTQIPHSVLEQFSWKRIRQLNRAAFIRYITEFQGYAPQDLGRDCLESSCPRCSKPGDLGSPLRIEPIRDWMGYIVECWKCGMNDEQLLQWMKEHPIGKVDRAEPAQLAFNA